MQSNDTAFGTIDESSVAWGALTAAVALAFPLGTALIVKFGMVAPSLF